MSTNDLEGDDIWGDSGAPEGGESKQPDAQPEMEDDETRHMSIGEIRQRIHLLNNDIRIMKSDVQRIQHESRAQRDRIRENQEKVKLNKQLPYLVANVVEVLEPDAEDGACHCSTTSSSDVYDCSECTVCVIVSNITPHHCTNRPRGRRKGDW